MADRDVTRYPLDAEAVGCAAYNAPRLYYLSEHARTRRARKKNKKRIMELHRRR